MRGATGAAIVGRVGGATGVAAVTTCEPAGVEITGCGAGEGFCTVFCCSWAKREACRRAAKLPGSLDGEGDGTCWAACAKAKPQKRTAKPMFLNAFMVASTRFYHPHLSSLDPICKRLACIFHGLRPHLKQSSRSYPRKIVLLSRC